MVVSRGGCGRIVIRLPPPDCELSAFAGESPDQSSRDGNIQDGNAA
jgi:hypothetical protein